MCATPRPRSSLQGWLSGSPFPDASTSPTSPGVVICYGFRMNMAFLITNPARASRLVERPGPALPLVLKIENLKRLAYNELFAERTVAMLPLAGTWKKCREHL